MPYKYYQEIESCAHFLYASEIAEITQLYTYKGEPHKRFVTAYYDHRFCELFASGEIRQIASVEKRQFGSAEIRQFESIEKSQS